MVALDASRSRQRGAELGRAGATAATRGPKADAAAAIALAARLHALTAGLERLAAFGVAAGAGDAATVLRVFALAFGVAEIEPADLNVILDAAASKSAIAYRLNETLEIGTLGLIQAASNTETPLVFLELELALAGLLEVAITGRGCFGCVHDRDRHRPSPLVGSPIGRRTRRSAGLGKGWDSKLRKRLSR